MLLLGERVLRPAPYELVQALSTVEVTNGMEGGDGFSMTFALKKERQLDYSLLNHPLLTKPGNRVAIGVMLGAKPEVLIDGAIEYYQVSLDPEPGPSTLTVTGKELTIQLDLTQRDEAFPRQTDSEIVESVLGRPEYSDLRLVPQVTPTADRPPESERIEWEQGTDLSLIQALAKRNGYVFYLEPRPFGATTAYWD